jgi:hypothetical protein
LSISRNLFEDFRSKNRRREQGHVSKEKSLAVTLVMIFGSLLANAGIPNVGQKAPAFSLSTPDGHSLSLSEFTRQGTVVLVVLRSLGR